MDSSSIGMLVALVILIAMSAYFSATETAFTSLNRIRMKNKADNGDRRAARTLELAEDYDKLLSTILIGNNIVNITATTVATVLCTHWFKEYGPTVSTVALTIIILIFGEITPKTVAAQKAEKVALLVCKVISFCVTIFKPVVAVLNVLTGFLTRLFGCIPGEKVPLITAAELKTIVNVSHEEGVLELDERTMINNVFDFGDSKAKDVMTPRTDIIA